jgi:hypothetical protein
MSVSTESVVCPHCGASIAASAPACPECGSDEQTGWSEQSYLDGVGLPDNEEYDELLQKEFGGALGGRRHRPLWQIATAVGLLVVVVWMVLSRAL